MATRDRKRLGDDGWIGFLEGRDPQYPTRSLRAALSRVRERVAAMRSDRTTPDTRLADDPMKYNPATTTALVELTLGGLHPGHRGQILHCRLRYFDPVKRRAGLPEDVAALVTSIDDRHTVFTLVNISQSEARVVLVQTGAYGEHRCESVKLGDTVVAVNGSCFEVRLEPGCGAELVVRTKRHANRPTLSFPWSR